MKSHASAVAARRYAPEQFVAWLLEITDDGASWRAATRALVLDGTDFPDAIAEPPQWAMESIVPGGLGLGGVVASTASVRVADVAGNDGSLRAWIVARDPVGLSARLVLLWLDESGLPATDDAVVMLEGVVTGVGFGPSAVRLELRDRLSSRLALPACRLLTRAMMDNEPSPMLGAPLPLVFGTHVDAPLSPLRSGPLTRLAGAVSGSDGVIPLVSLEGFPAAGTAQIGGELIAYTSTDLVNVTLGTSGDPVTRGVGASAHASGARVRWVPAGGFQWIVADHACAAVTAVRADGLVLSGADWTAELRDIGGVDAQVVTMDRWPVVLGELAHGVTADFEGWPAPASGPLENPADILELLISHPRFAALDSALLDSPSLDAVRGELGDRGYGFSRVVAFRASLGELIQSAARESVVWVRSGGAAVTFARAGVSPHPADALETLDETRALEPDAALDLTPIHAGQLHDRLELYSTFGTLGFVRAVGSLAHAGFRPLRLALDWLAPAAATAWPDLGFRLWPRVSESHPRHAQAFPLGASLLEPGDVVHLVRAPLGLDLVPLWVGRVRLNGSPARVEVTMTGPEAGELCWSVDHETFIRHFGFCRRLVVFVAGRPVMSVERDGALHLRGALSEGGLASPPTLPAPVHLIGGDLYFGAGSSGSFTAFARLDAGGNLELRGTIAEASAITFTQPDACLSSNATRFYLSPNFRDPAFEYRPGTQVLHLKAHLTGLMPL